MMMEPASVEGTFPKKSTFAVAFETPSSPHILIKSPATAARSLSTYVTNCSNGHDEPGPDVHLGTGTTALLIYTLIRFTIGQPWLELTFNRTYCFESVVFPGSGTIFPASCLTDDGSGFEHESRSSAMYPRKLTTCEERNERFAGGIRVVGRGYTPHSLEEFHTPSAERIGGRLLSCYRDNFFCLGILTDYIIYVL